MKKILLIAGLAASLSLSAMAQAYHNDALLATNTMLPLFPTNFVSANYFVSPDPNVPMPGNGLFELKPQIQSVSAYLAGAPGPALELIYTAYNVTNSALPPIAGTNANILATFTPVLDDATVRLLSSGSLAAPYTNNTTYTVTFPISASATNPGTFYTSIAFSGATNNMNCKWAKLIGLSVGGSAGLPLNYGIQIREFRVGYPGPVAGPLQ